VDLFSRCAETNLASVRNRGWAPNLDYARLEFTDRSGISMVYISYFVFPFSYDDMLSKNTLTVLLHLDHAIGRCTR
jgi:hypothetical protein